MTPAKAAFEISKGARQVITLSESDVERCLDPRELLDGLEERFAGGTLTREEAKAHVLRFCLPAIGEKP